MKRTMFFAIISVLAATIAVSCEGPVNTDPSNETDNGTEENPDTGTEEDPEIFEYAIGDLGPAGGWIFYVDKNDEFKWTYLEVAPKSTEWTGNPWGGYSTEVGPGAQGTAIGTGASNTAAIVAAYGNEDPWYNEYTFDPSFDPHEYAAKLAHDLNHNGYDDWFLPSQDEIWEIWWNLVSDQSETNDGRGEPKADAVGGFEGRSYWSSSEYDSLRAWRQNLGDGYRWRYYKSDQWDTLRIRAVRSF